VVSPDLKTHLRAVRDPESSDATAAVLDRAASDASVVAIKVLVPQISFTQDLAESLAGAALRGTEVTVVIGPLLRTEPGIIALRGAGAVVVVGEDELVGDRVSYVVMQRDGTLTIGCPVRGPGPLARQLVLEAFNRWTVRGRAV
jgi:hypothetical protein